MKKDSAAKPIINPVAILKKVGSTPIGFAISTKPATDTGQAANFEIVNLIRIEPAIRFKKISNAFIINSCFIPVP